MPTNTSGGFSNGWVLEPDTAPDFPPTQEAPEAPEPEVAPIPPDAATVRLWARTAGIAVPARGAIPTAVMDQYLEAHSG